MNKQGWMVAACATALACIAAAAPSQAAETILTFDGFACTDVDGGATNQNCTANGQFIGADYGSSAALAVSYDASEASGSRVSLQYSSAGFYSSGSGKAYAFPAGPADEPSAIYFTPGAGYEVSFSSFTWDKLSATSEGFFFFKVLDESNNVLFSAGANSALGYTVNTAYFAGPLTFLFGNGGQGGVAVDNVAVDVRQTAAPAVPEPASWALMIAGFGLAGGAMRSGRRMRFAVA